MSWRPAGSCSMLRSALFLANERSNPVKQSAFHKHLSALHRSRRLFPVRPSRRSRPSPKASPEAVHWVHDNIIQSIQVPILVEMTGHQSKTPPHSGHPGAAKTKQVSRSVKAQTVGPTLTSEKVTKSRKDWSFLFEWSIRIVPLKTANQGRKN